MERYLYKDYINGMCIKLLFYYGVLRLNPLANVCKKNWRFKSDTTSSYFYFIIIQHLDYMSSILFNINRLEVPGKI